MRQLAWCGVIAPVLRIGLILVLGFLDPGYSQARDYLSELSAREAPHAALMNIAGIGLVGVLLVVFSVALYRASRSDLLATAGSTCLAVSGVAFVFVALFPCDPGCSLAAPTTTMQVHLLAGAIAMTAQSLAPLAFGLRLFSMRGGRWYASFSLACGAVALLAVAVLFAAQPVLTLPGLVQKTFQLATDLWVLVSALVLLRSNFPGDLQE